jgi:hypothetical protein
LSVTKLPSYADVENARKNPVVPTATSHTLRL